MGPKKKAAKAAAAPAAGTAAPAAVAGGTEAPPAVAFTPAEAKKLAKLLKASDRGKRLDAIRVVSENHAYITTGGCLLPLLESVVVKKKTEEVVRAASQVHMTLRVTYFRESVRYVATLGYAMMGEAPPCLVGFHDL